MSLYTAPNRGCPLVISGGLGRLNSIPQLLRGVLVIHTYDAVHFDPEEPFWPQIESQELHPTVRFYVHSLNWIDFIVDRAVDLPQKEWNDVITSGVEFAWIVAWHWWEANSVTPEWKSDEHVWGGHTVAIRAASLSVLSELSLRMNGFLKPSCTTVSG